jgi:signal transduction histidine kinase
MKSNLRWRGRGRSYLILALLVLASAIAGLALSWTAFGSQIGQYAYDFLFRLEPPRPWQPSSIVLAIDEPTMTKYGGLIGMRAALADGLDRIAPAHPAVVAVDVILAEPGQADDRLEAAFAHTPNLVLSCDMQPDGGRWEEPIPRFRKYAVAVGEVHADLDKYDAVSRDLTLEKAAGHDRRWALPLEAFRAVRHADILESPDDLAVGPVRIPSPIADGRTIRIRYAPLAMDGIPHVSIADLDNNPSLASRFAGKVVFAGTTAQTATRDRWMTPYSNGILMPGVEMHANVYETIARQMFLVDAPLSTVVATCFALALCAGMAFAFTSRWFSYLLALLVLAAAQAIPAVSFAHSIVWPWLPGTLATVFAASAAAAWRHLLVRRQLVRAEGETDRYRQAMHFVTHEMKTPLTAIQGSSELIGRYASMPEAKRKQMAELINSESKRLARMIETFLSVERLSDGQMEMKRERFPLLELVERCAERARPLAENKQIEIDIAKVPLDHLTGDRELMEYAVYNLLTNAVKYSPPHTRVTVYGEDERGDRVRLSVEDQGIGMDKKEVAHIFEKFYRTKRAEQSGEKGTGIGLSIVEQIVTQHGGTIQVESEPGKGSRFTLVLRRA